MPPEDKTEKHTAGPYFAVDGHFVASKLTDDGNIPSGFLLADLRGCPNRVANSALFAASPALLAAAKAALFKIESLVATEKKVVLAPWPRSGVDYVGCDPADCHEVQLLRAAIASAEPGETK